MCVFRGWYSCWAYCWVKVRAFACFPEYLVWHFKARVKDLCCNFCLLLWKLMLHLVLLAITNPDFSDLILHTKSVTFGLVVEWRCVYVRLFQKLIVYGGCVRVDSELEETAGCIAENFLSCQICFGRKLCSYFCLHENLHRF